MRLMQRMRNPLAFLILAAILWLPASALAWSSGAGQAGSRLAYIDPGAGSFVVQALIAMVAGIAVTGRLYWTKIKTMLGIASRDDDEDSLIDDD
jgi:hypothetical protein